MLGTGAAGVAAEDSGDGSSPPTSGQEQDVTDGLLPDSLGPGAQPPPTFSASDVAYPNLGSELSALAVASAAASPPSLSDGTNSTLGGEPLLLTMQFDGNRNGVLGFLADNGVTPANVVGDYVEAYVPPDLLGPLAQQTGVARVRAMPQPFKDLGSVTSGGVRAHGADVWHDNGYTGDGVKVGVIDTSTTTTSKDGFTGLRALRGTELPATVVGRCYIDAGKPTSDLANCDTAGGDQHGTAVAESLMDVAPDAALYISNPLTWADLHSAVVWMHGQGVKIINFSVSWSFHGAPDGTSPVSPSPLNTAKWAVDNGMTWVNSAGNYGKRAWFGSFADSDNDGYHEWAGSGATADEAQVLELDASDSLFVNMRWDGTWGGATKDLDLEVRYSATLSGAQTVVGTSADVQKGGAADYPWEGISLTAANSGFYWVYAKKKTASAAPTWVQFMVFGQISEIDHYTPEGGSVTSPGDSSSPGVLAVGAGGDTHYWVPRAYSSRGPTPDGRTKPDVAGLDCEPTSLGKFCGTSQAAPHVAGLAALVVERNPSFTPSQVADYLRTNADERHGLYPSGWGHGFAWLNSGDFAKEDDGCWTPLSGSGNFTAIWSGPGPEQLSLGASAAQACKSQGRAGSYARYFGFTLGQQIAVTIDLSSRQDSYLLLRSGRNSRTAETVLYRDDSGGLGSSDSRIVATLPAGDYTIEATTDTGPPATGLFTLGVQGVPSQSWTQSTTRISIEADGDVTEGGDAVFTLSASPPPSSPLTVDVAVSSDGDFGITADQVTTSYSGHESATSQVTISTSGTGTLTMPTDDDKADEADGSVTATVMAAFDPARRYAVSTTSGSATVAIADDEPPDLTCVTALTGDGDVSGEWVASCASVENEGLAQFYGFTLGRQSEVTLDLTSPSLGYRGIGSNYPDLRVRNGRNSKFGSVAASGWGSRSPLIKTTLPAGDYMIEATSWQPVTPGTSFVLTVSGIGGDSSDPCVSPLPGNGSVDGAWTGSCDSEGRSASYGRFYTFSLDSQAAVTIDLESSEDTYLFLRSGLGRDGQELYRNDDGGDGYNSRISETLAAGDYTIEATTFNHGLSGTFVLTVAGLPTKTSPQSEPEISIAGGGGVTEGAAASFTVTAAPAPGADLDVAVSVSQSGDFGVTAGSRTVTISASGSETFAVATADDSADEADGSVTATVGSGTGYTVSSGSGSATVAVADNDVPEISIAGGGGVTEGAAASFTVTAAPSPAAGLDVTVSVSQSGDYGATTGSRTVTIPASGSETFTVATADDSADEADGSVTATVGSGSGYTVSSTQGAATVAVSDDDDPLPVVSIVGGSAVTEGGNASFTLTASPAPAAPLTVNVTVSQSGDFYVGIGPAIVQIATSGTHSLRLGTSDDSIDEADGSVTVSLSAGTGYTVSSTQGAASVAVSDDDVPEISIAAGSGVSEGTAASFTLTASPKPAAGLDVTVAVAQSGDFGAATGSRTVTVPASGSFTLTVATTGDSTDEADGSVTATVSTGTGYTVSSSAGSASVAVSDDDDPAECAPQLPDDAVTVDEVTGWRDGLSAAAAAGVKRFNRVLAALGVDTGDTPMTAEQAQGVADWLGNSRWDRISRTLAAVEQAQCDDDAEQDDPEISIAGGAGVVEGVAASFTLTASPKPAVDLDVTVTVAQSGDFGVSAGSRAVTIPASGSKAFTVATVDDLADEADGSVTVSVGSGTGYAVSSAQGAASVAVSDDDVPEISIAAGSGVVEGSAASFTLTASPKPAVGLDVAVAVSQSGDFGVATGSRTVAVTASGSATFTVATSGDSDDEADGSVTVSVGTGTGYTVSSSAGSTSVAVSDDDAPLVVADVCVSALEGDGSVAGQWTDACDSEGREGRYARFFTFSLAQRATVTIDLESSVDTYLFLRSGLGRDGGELSRNDDGGDGYNSRISESLAAGDYTVEATTFSRSTTGAFTLSVDGLTAQQPPAVLPEISIAAGSGVTEGGAASFTLTASPAPTSALAVDVTVSQSGDFGVTAGERTVTVPTSGSYTLTVATAGDSADEADGSVTVSVSSGTGYTVSSSNSSATVAVSDDDDPPPPPPDPEISVAAGSDVTEGGAASFTLTASPAPTSALAVDVTVSQSGDFGVTAGARTVTIPTSGSYILTVATTGDSTDEADGSVTVSVSSGTGYTVSSGNSSATVAVSDDDDPPPPPPPPPADCVSEETLGLARDYYELNRDRAPGYGRNWLRVLVAFGDVVDDQVTAFTAAEALEREQLWFGWRPFREALECIEAAQQPASPQISVAAGSGVTEGSAASFTLTASPAPAAALTVDVTVSQSGDFGVSTGARTVTISTAGIFALSVDTTGDSADEADGSVTVTIDTGTGYTVSSSAGSATVAVSDDDDPAPPPPPPPPAEPEISIAAGSDVAEGTAATFTLTASPAPTTALSVSVTVSQSGSFGVSTGARTVTIPTGGSYTLTVATADDSTDEADGSVTATVGSGTGYTVSSSDSSATVAVADDDVPEISIAAGSGVTEGSAATFTVTASPVPAASLDVSVTVSQSGDFASIGERTVTIPTTGSATFTVATTNDTTDEADGSVTATLASGTGYTVSSSAGAATVAVSDDDDPAPPPAGPPTVTVGDATAVEGAQDLAFVVTLSKPNPVPITFRYGGYGRTATLWQDWSIDFRRTFTLDAGDTSIEITVPVIDDDTPEDTETLRVYVYATSGIVIRDGFLYATGTITDDD